MVVLTYFHSAVPLDRNPSQLRNTLSLAVRPALCIHTLFKLVTPLELAGLPYLIWQSVAMFVSMWPDRGEGSRRNQKKKNTIEETQTKLQLTILTMTQSPIKCRFML